MSFLSNNRVNSGYGQSITSSSSQYSPTYEDKAIFSTLIRGYDIKEICAQELTNKIDVLNKTIKKNCNIEIITGVIRFFKLDYATGEEILNLMNSGDESNELVATTMLFASVKESLKEEIIKEIFK